MIEVTGTLACDAEARATTLYPPATCAVFLTINEGSGVPIEARLPMSDMSAATVLARSMPRGHAVTLMARGVRPRTDHSTLAVILVDAVLVL